MGNVKPRRCNELFSLSLQSTELMTVTNVSLIGLNVKHYVLKGLKCFFLVSVYNRLEISLKIVCQFIFSEPFKSNINTGAYSYLIIIDTDSITDDIGMAVQVNLVSNHATQF